MCRPFTASDDYCPSDSFGISCTQTNGMNYAHGTQPANPCSVWLGINLGARNCQISKLRSDGQVQLITNHSGEQRLSLATATSSYISIPVNSTEMLVGRGITNTRPERVIYDACVDHNFGNPPLSDTSYQRYAHYDRDSGNYWVDQGVGWISQLDAIAEILGHLRSLAIEGITQGESDQNTFVGQLNAVIAVPAYSSHNYRCLVAQAAHLAGFDSIRIINQSTCAMLAYRKDALSHRLPTPTGPESLMALLSLGARSIEASVFAVRPSGVALIWTQGSAALGRDDFTAALLAHVIKSYGSELTRLSAREHRELWGKCEKAIAELSRLRKTRIGLSSQLWLSGTSVQDMDLSRDSFWGVCETVYQRVEATVAASFLPFKGSISHIALVGAASLLCHLKERVVAKHVGEGCTFIPPSCFVPQEAVAVGAALKAYFLDAGSTDRRADLRADVSDYAYNTVHLLSRNGQALCVIQPCEQIPTPVGKEPSFLNEERYRLIQSRDPHAGVCGELRLTAPAWVSIHVNELGQITVKGDNCQLYGVNSSNLLLDAELLRARRKDHSPRPTAELKTVDCKDLNNRTLLNDKNDFDKKIEFKSIAVALKAENSLRSINQSPSKQKPPAKLQLALKDDDSLKSPPTCAPTPNERPADRTHEAMVPSTVDKSATRECGVDQHHTKFDSQMPSSQLLKAPSSTQNGKTVQMVRPRLYRLNLMSIMGGSFKPVEGENIGDSYAYDEAKRAKLPVKKAVAEEKKAMPQHVNRSSSRQESLCLNREKDVPPKPANPSLIPTTNQQTTAGMLKASISSDMQGGCGGDHYPSDIESQLRPGHKPSSPIAKAQSMLKRNSDNQEEGDPTPRPIGTDKALTERTELMERTPKDGHVQTPMSEPKSDGWNFINTTKELPAGESQKKRCVDAPLNNISSSRLCTSKDFLPDHLLQSNQQPPASKMEELKMAQMNCPGKRYVDVVDEQKQLEVVVEGLIEERVHCAEPIDNEPVLYGEEYMTSDDETPILPSTNHQPATVESLVKETREFTTGGGSDASTSSDIKPTKPASMTANAHSQLEEASERLGKKLRDLKLHLKMGSNGSIGPKSRHTGSSQSSGSVSSGMLFVQIEEAKGEDAAPTGEVAKERITKTTSFNSACRSPIKWNASKRSHLKGSEAKRALEPLEIELRNMFPFGSMFTPVWPSVKKFYDLTWVLFSKSAVTLVELESVEEEARRLLLLGRAIQRMDAIIEAMKPVGIFSRRVSSYQLQLTRRVLQNDYKYIEDAKNLRTQLIKFDPVTQLNNDSRPEIAQRLQDFILKISIRVQGHHRMSRDKKLKTLLNLSDFKCD